MSKSEITYGLAMVGVLASFLVMPSLADDLSQPAVPPTYDRSNSDAVPSSQQTMPAEKYGEPASGQSSESREPTYVWQGNHPDNHGATGTSTLPHAVQAGNVRYIMGGIGDEERDALDAVKNEYDLHVISTNNAGEFNGDTQLTILDRQGEQLLSVSGGPLFYVDLPAGTYTVEASNGGAPEKRKVTVGQKEPSSVYFRW